MFGIKILTKVNSSSFLALQILKHIKYQDSYISVLAVVNSVKMYSMLYPGKLVLRKQSSGRCSAEKGVLRSFRKFTGKHLCQRLFLNKVAGLRWWLVLVFVVGGIFLVMLLFEKRMTSKFHISKVHESSQIIDMRRDRLNV